TGASDICGAACVEDANPSECMVTCYTDYGFSEPCAECAGELMGCMDQNCPSACTDEAMAADGGEGCMDCLVGTCGQEFWACFNDLTTEPEPPPELGLCANPEDGAILDSGATDTCGESCLDDPDPYECTVGCFLDAGTSQGCADCSGNLIECLADNCPEACTEEATEADEGEACLGCIFGVCGAEFGACYNEPDPGPPPVDPGMCVNPGDGAIMESGQVDDCPTDCLEESDSAQCMTDCYEDAGVSTDCASCAGDVMACVVEVCPDACTAEGMEADDGQACDACVTGPCGTEFTVCFNNPETGPPAEPGVCLNPEDEALIAQPGDIIGLCFFICLGDDDTGGCLET
ncbi:MAG: hypothetical protein QF464_23675, partial [Myxococcota bacterium]|nr:hypothetical protein [Myxococcota bacterium]